jgi:hypothetical protein
MMLKKNADQLAKLKKDQKKLDNALRKVDSEIT